MLVTMALPGSVYLYQGEELGLPEVWQLPDEVRQDPTWQRSGGREPGRDGCRVPLPWTVDGPSFGFGSGGAWLPQPPEFGPLSVAAQHTDPTSTLHLYRAALRLRSRYLCHDEDLSMLDLGPGVLAFSRGSGVVCVANMGDEPVRRPAGRVLLASAALANGAIPPDTAAWILPA